MFFHNTKPLSEVLNISRPGSEDLYWGEYSDTKNKIFHVIVHKDDKNSFSFTNYPKKRSYALVNKKGGFELLNQYGRHSNIYHFQKKDHKEVYGAGKIFGNIDNDINNPDFELVEFVNTDTKEFLRKLNGELIPEPMLIDHNPGHLDDKNYKLDELAEKLIQRDDVAFITHTERFSNKTAQLIYAPLKNDDPNLGGIINDIEHHLEEGESEPDEQEQITLYYFPKLEDYKKLFEWALHHRTDPVQRKDNSDKRLFFAENFVVRNILGGDEFYKLHPGILDETPPRKFKN